ncbi:MAG: AraC family transcriptional regulator [Candidatus Accumulibacter sp.]|jgi:AraC-like DNA-binding protein/mannose-6-phosphate isomerase-like protein (cupin superfamily)|nr:AraC family transcriptional regulator [Accumulibacter sp.]
MFEHFSSVECHRFQDACFVNALSPAQGKHHLLFFPVGNAGVVWHNGNWQDILPNRLFCIEAGTGFSVRCGEGPVDCFVIRFESGDFGHAAVNDYIIIQQEKRAEFIAMNVELATACLTLDGTRSFRAFRRILKEIGQTTMANHIAFAIRHVGPRIDIPDHFHSNEYQIEYFAAGAGGIRLGQHWMEFGPGSFCFIPPLIHHEIVYSQSPDMDNYSIKFQFIKDPRIKNPPCSPFMMEVAEEKQAEVLSLLKKIVGEYTMDLPISPENLNRLIALVHEIERREGEDGEKDSLVGHVKRIVRAGCAGPLRTSAIAAQVGVSPEHLSRKFHKITGGTLAEYITTCRLGSALVMLRNTNLPIGQIAIECGFKSVHYLSSRFRKYYACAPSEMRRRKFPEKVAKKDGRELESS